MKLDTRREFLKGVAANAAAATLCRGAEWSSSGNLTSVLRNQLISSGYDPDGENGVLLAVIADAHIFLGSEYPQYRTDHYDDNLISELNSLNSLIDELVIAGDVISYHSMSPGIPPYQIHREWAIQEYELAKIEVQRFNYRRWIIPGNHDTTAYEPNAELFQEHMQVPPYQKAEFAGVPVFFLNSGNAGMLDPVQHAWLLAEAALIDSHQEVLIVVHYPPFFALWLQGGVKRILFDIFKNHKVPVWLISGHNHAFAEQVFQHGDATFVQTQVTCASYLPQSFGDKRNPGYVLLALQDGKLVSRIYRSLKDVGFQARPNISHLGRTPVAFPFDTLVGKVVVREEGFYPRPDHIISYSGVDVGSYLTFCKKVIFRIRPSDYLTPVTEFIISGSVENYSRPTCEFSFDGQDGTWISAPFPLAKGAGLYRVTIPEQFHNGAEFRVKLDNGLTGTVQGFIIWGWALETDSTALSSYLRWTLATYGNLEKSAMTAPASITPGTILPNIVNFGFNLQASGEAEVSGMPKIGMNEASGREGFPTITFARMNPEANPGVSY
ncbi:MAG: hypothetical protein EOP84_17775, partial [Verrucomicrobiaceae bacterium]